MKTILLLLIALCLSGCEDYERTIEVKVIKLVPVSPGWNGREAYSIVEVVGTHERRVVYGIEIGNVGETITIRRRSTFRP